METLLYAFAFAATGFLVAAVLTQPGEVLSWWPGLVARLIRTRGKSPGDWNGLQWAVYKITYGCSKCISGQLALWFSFFIGFGWGRGFVCVALAVFFAYALEKHYD